jgi:hypothetical protein
MYVCMYTCMYVYMYVCMYVYMYVCICVSTYVCMYICIMCIHACMYVYVWVRMCIHICMHVLCVCMYVCISVSREDATVTTSKYFLGIRRGRQREIITFIWLADNPARFEMGLPTNSSQGRYRYSSLNSNWIIEKDFKTEHSKIWRDCGD